MAFMVEVKVTPSSGRNAWRLEASGQLKCFLKSAPEKGLANQELLKLIAKALGITQAKVVLVKGATNRTKLIKIDCELTFDQLLAALGIERQQTMF